MVVVLSLYCYRTLLLYRPANPSSQFKLMLTQVFYVWLEVTYPAGNLRGISNFTVKFGLSGQYETRRAHWRISTEDRILTSFGTSLMFLFFQWRNINDWVTSCCGEGYFAWMRKSYCCFVDFRTNLRQLWMGLGFKRSRQLEKHRKRK